MSTLTNYILAILILQILGLFLIHKHDNLAIKDELLQVDLCTLIFLSLAFLSIIANAAIITIKNNCPYTVWAASIPVGGGMRLNNGQVWTISVPSGTSGGRIWARTNCNFDTSRHGRCQTGNCNGLLECQTNGSPPNTLVEFALNQYNNHDLFDMSVVDGFNVPMSFHPTSNGCTIGPTCTAPINQQCPNVLRAPGGCNNPCTVFKTDEYCCTSGICRPLTYSSFFKNLCPDVFSYPQDDQSSSYSCPTGTNYKVVFCP